MVLIRAQTAITFRQTAVTAYFRSTQLLLFAFARQRIGGEKLLWCVNGHVFQSYYTLEMYKFYEFAMPLTAKAKNLLLIIQNLIYLKIDILAET